jgi:hypothetical protein
MKEAIWSRVGPAAGLLFFPVLMLGFSIHGYPDIKPTDTQLAKWLASVDISTFKLGVYIEALGTVLLIPFAAWFCAHLRNGARDASWPALAMLATAAGWVILTLPINESWVGLVEQGRKGLDIRIAQTVVSINQAWFEVTGILFGLMLMAAGIAMVRGGAMSPWVAYAAIILGVGSIVAVPFGAASTPVQLLGFLWPLAVAGYFTIRPTRTLATNTTKESLASGVAVTS